MRITTRCARAAESSDRFELTIMLLQNLYILSELAQHLIKLRAKSEGWALPTLPQSSSMPSDIFALIKDKVKAKKVADTAFLTEEQLGKVTYSGSTRATAKLKATKVDKVISSDRFDSSSIAHSLFPSQPNGVPKKRKSSSPR